MPSDLILVDTLFCVGMPAKACWYACWRSARRVARSTSGMADESLGKPFNLARWIDKHAHLLKPPVGNKLVFDHGYGGAGGRRAQSAGRLP